MNHSLILIVEDDASMRFVLDECLKREEYRTLQAADGEEAVELFAKHNPDLMLLDLKIPRISGMEVLRNCRAQNPEALFIVLTGHATIHTAVEAMKEGAYDFISKPFELETLLKTINEAVKQGSIIKENRAAREQPRENHDGICRSFTSPVFIRVNKMVEGVAASEYTVLIEGESGTGKELLAQSIHNYSQRKNMPFVAINCAALPESLLESELFGYESGSFTGARKTGKIGLFEQANGGSIFLDEIGDISPNLQSRLLRVLQERQIMRIGSDRMINIDTRIIAATNKDLVSEVEQGNFRRDLYYRLNVISICIEPLKKRTEDILPLMSSFLGQKYNQLTDSDKDILCTYTWPGNIRELESAAIHYNTLSMLPKYLLNSPVEPIMVNKTISYMDDNCIEMEILKIIMENTQFSHGIGRMQLNSCLKSLQIYIGDASLRNVLHGLEERNLISICNGRGGTRITEKGIQKIKSS